MDLADSLRASFCPPLDTALLAALLLDLPEIPSEQDVSEIRETLRQLASQAASDEGVEELERAQPSHDVSESLTASSAVTGQLDSLPDPPLRPRPRQRREPSAQEVERALEEWHISTRDDAASDGRPLPPPRKHLGPDDPLLFLTSLFPTTDKATLERRLADLGGDVENLMDSLLSEEYISKHDEDLLDDYASDTSSRTTATTTSRYSTKSERSLAKQRRKMERSSLRASNVLNLTDVRHRSSPTPYSSRSTDDASSVASGSGSNDPNRWVILESTSTYLATLLRIPAGRITSAYHRHDSSLPLAVDSVLAALEHERPLRALASADAQLAELAMVLPPTTGSATLRRLLAVTEGDVSDALDLKTKLDEIERDHGSALQNGLFGLGAPSSSEDARRVVTVRQDSTLEPVLPVPIIQTTPRVGSGWSTVPMARKVGSSQGIHPHIPGLGGSSRPPTSALHRSMVTPTGNESAEECLAIAASFLEKRNEAYRSAGSHWQRNRGAERGAAWHWAQVGREMEAKRRKWEQRAAFATVDERRGKDSSTIDLHHLNLHNALSVARDSCNTWWSSRDSASSYRPLRIVTGRGRHSRDQNPVLLPALTKMLDREGWKWKWDNSLGGSNPGAVLVLGTV